MPPAKPKEPISKPKTSNTPPVSEPVSDQPRVIPEKVLFSWTAPSRPFKRRNRQFYVTLIGIAAVVGVVIFLVDGWLPVILIISLLFLLYVMSTVEPESINYTITNKGITMGQDKTYWQQLGQFWFSRRFDSSLLIFSAANLPGRIELIIHDKDKETIKKTLETYLPLEEVPPAFLDRAANWFSKKLPQS